MESNLFGALETPNCCVCDKPGWYTREIFRMTKGYCREHMPNDLRRFQQYAMFVMQRGSARNYLKAYLERQLESDDNSAPIQSCKGV